jgi:hypothetical protein
MQRQALENELGQGNSMVIQRDDDPSETMARLAKDTEQLAQFELENFSPVLKRWHPFPGASAVATLHSCYGVLLKQYVAKATCLTNELVHVLHAAGRLEKALVPMMVEDVADSDDGGRSLVREVVPYDVDSLVARFLRTWIKERLRSDSTAATATPASGPAARVTVSAPRPAPTAARTPASSRAASSTA